MNRFENLIKGISCVFISLAGAFLIIFLTNANVLEDFGTVYIRPFACILLVLSLLSLIPYIIWYFIKLRGTRDISKLYKFNWIWCALTIIVMIILAIVLCSLFIGVNHIPIIGLSIYIFISSIAIILPYRIGRPV